MNQTEEVWSAAKAIGSKKSPETWAELTLKAKHYFNTFMLQLINNYLGHYKAPSKKNSRGRAMTSASEVFDFDAYFGQFDEEHSYFLREAQQTMMLTHLIEETYEILFSQNLNLNPPLVPLAFSPNQQKNLQNPETVQGRNNMSTTPNTFTAFNALSQTQGLTGLGAFIRELKSILDTFGRLAKNSKKNLGFVDILDPKILNYVEIVHGCLIKEAMKQFCLPEKINLVPYLAQYYCNYQLGPEKEGSPVIDEEKARVKALEEEKNHFKRLNNQIILDLNSMFSSAELKSLDSLSSPSKKNSKYSATPIKHSYETLEVVDLSYLRESFMNSRKVHSQGSEGSKAGQISSRPNHPRPPLEYLPGRMGPRLNIEVQKNHDSVDGGAKSAPLDFVQQGDGDSSLKSKKSFSSTQSFSLKPESPKISESLPHKRLESGTFTDLAHAVIKDKNELNLNLLRTQSEKVENSNKPPFHDVRRKKKIFEPKSPERDAVKALKHADILKTPPFKKSESAPMEVHAQKENFVCMTQMERTVPGCALEASDISLWEMIVGDNNRRRRSTNPRRPTNKNNVLQEINQNQEEPSIMIKNLDTVN